MVASSYLAYGGTMQVIRAKMILKHATGVGLANAFVGTASIRIKSETHYNQLGYDENAITGVTLLLKHW